MKFLARHRWKILILIVVAGVATYIATWEEDRVWVSVAAAHYFPPNHRIDEFQINTFDYGNSGFDGKVFTGDICCVWLPRHWRPGMVVDVRWVESDWSETPIDDKEHFDRKKIKLVGMYRAKVPIERYEEAGDVFVHFFNGGKVRVAPGVADFRDKEDSKESIERAEKMAVVGQRVSELYTPEEEAKILEDRERERRHRGTGDD